MISLTLNDKERARKIYEERLKYLFNYFILVCNCEYSALFTLSKVFESIREYQTAYILICIDGIELYNLPRDIRDSRLCLAAVKDYGPALSGVPEHAITQEMCEVAVKQCGLAIEHVPQKYLSAEICMSAVKQDGISLMLISDINKELCDEAVKQHPKAAQYITHRYDTKRYKLVPRTKYTEK